MSINYDEIMNIMEEISPIHLAENWDNCGLLVGNTNREIKKILVALDAVSSVIDEAIEKDVDLIITHHPFLFSGIKKVTSQTTLGINIYKLIQNNIGVYSAHTNLDVAFGGTNDIFAKMAGLTDICVLEETYYEKLYKIAVFVPAVHSDNVKNAMCNVGAGYLGNYSNCTFESVGKGAFCPLEGAKPFIGTINEIQYTDEVKIETIVSENNLSQVIKAMLVAHPYEEVAYDIYELFQKGVQYGIGRIGNLKKEITFGEFSTALKTKLGLKTMRVVGDLNKSIKRVGLCTGSGFEYMEKAKKMGADVYITGDLKFHESQKAIDAGMCVIDATHYASENMIVPVLCEYIRNKMREKNKEVEIITSLVNGQPFQDI